MTSKKIIQTIESLKKNNFPVWLVKNRNEILPIIADIIPKESTIGYGGSQTIEDLNLLNHLSEKGYRILDRRNIESREEKKRLIRQSMLADVFLCSSNAITQDGKLVNIDGNGNRVAAITFGPEKVIIIAGKNKIVKNEKKAWERIQNYVAPKNAQRLNKKVPCIETGKCTDCNSEDRICRIKAVHERQNNPGRINIIIVEEDLGY